MAQVEGKKELISKANKSMVIACAVAGFCIMFSIIASVSLWQKRTYQAKVIDAKEEAVSQLDANKAAVDQLAVSYKAFVGTQTNVIGGNPNGSGDRDGNNAKIVLDALPSKYDFPAFITSLEKLLNSNNFKLESITGTDDELAQAKAAATKKPVEIPFTFESNVGNYAKLRDLLVTTEKSIRPIKIKSLEITGGDGAELTVQVDGVSYYQAAKGLTIEKKVIKQ
jgi:hypothetical protein